MGGSGCSVCWSLALFSILILEVSPVGVPLPAWSLLLTPCTSGRYFWVFLSDNGL